MVYQTGRNEVRAIYGGFGIAMSSILIAAIYAPALRTGVCLTLAAALIGMAVGRVISGALDRRLARAPLTYLLLEVMTATLLLCAV